MRPFIALALSVLIVGCAPKPAEDPAPAVPTASAAPAGGGGVAPIGGGAAGGMTPVSGGESVDGAGMGGVGSAAKDMARGAAAKASAPAGGGVENGE